MRKIPIALLLAGLFVFAFGVSTVTPPTSINLEPNQMLLQYDDDGPPSSFKKIGYASNGIGWGVKFSPDDNDHWYRLVQIQVDLCPPPPGFSDCQEEVRVFLPDGPGGTPGTMIFSRPYDVRLGEWWHYIDVNQEIWLKGEFYAFSVTRTGYNRLYQWFDTTDNAPSGTQWWFNGTSFSEYASPSCGDIRIRAVVERHDVGATAIENPVGQWDQGSLFIPMASLLNYTEVAEANVPVRLWITEQGSETPMYDQTIQVNFPPNGMPFSVEFPEGQAAWAGGWYVVRCSTMLPHDWEVANDMASADMFVRVLDVQNLGTFIGDNIPFGSVKTPVCQVYNAGNTIVSFPVSCWITGTTYSSTKTVTNLHPGDFTLVSFDPWNAGPVGWHTCFTNANLPGDMNPSNDQTSYTFEVIANPNDVGAIALLSPVGLNLRSTVYYPLTYSIRNYGTSTNSFYAEVLLTHPSGQVDPYTVYVPNLVGGVTRNVTFTNRNYPEIGRWDVKCYTKLASDANRANDTSTGYFIITASKGWTEFLSTPGALKLDKGSAITADSKGNLFLLGGKKSGSIYQYGVGDEPIEIPLPDAVQAKLGAGASLTSVSDKLYMLVANRTVMFEQYDPATGVWSELAALPGGASNKPAKAGAAMTVANGIIYTFKGAGTDEFYSFNPATGAWTALPGVPNTGRLVKDGAALCNTGTRIFAFKGACKEFYTYDIATGVWQRLTDLPRKARAGATLSYLDGAIYATVGGNNEFYTYDTERNTWTRIDDLPLAPDYRKTTSGAAMIATGNILVISKGRRAQTLYAYEPSPANDAVAPENDVMSGRTTTAERFTLTNPVQASARIAVNGNSLVRLYTSSGTLVRSVQTSAPVELDVRDLANGSYILHVTTGLSTTTRSLIVQH